MENNSSKVVRLSAETLSYIEEYRELLMYDTENINILKYITEMNYDNIILSALCDAISYCTKS